jgi:hypothetical protein
VDQVLPRRGGERVGRADAGLIFTPGTPGEALREGAVASRSTFFAVSRYPDCVLMGSGEHAVAFLVQARRAGIFGGKVCRGSALRQLDSPASPDRHRASSTRAPKE